MAESAPCHQQVTARFLAEPADNGMITMDAAHALQSPLYWVQPGAFQRSFELHTAGQQNIGSLRFEKASGTTARGDSPYGAWTLKRVGFLKPRVTVTRPGSEEDLGVFHSKFFRGGTLEMAGMGMFQWRQADFWGTQWSFIDSNDNVLVTFRPGSETGGLSNIFKTQAIADVNLNAADPTVLSLLVILGWYLIIMHKNRTAV